MFALPSTVSLVSAALICNGTICRPGWPGRRRSRTRRRRWRTAAGSCARRTGASTGIAIRSQNVRAVPPRVASASPHCGRRPLHRGKEGDHHERHLEVDVGEVQAGHLVDPGAVGEDVAPERVLQPDPQHAVQPDRRDEREGEHDAAELREHAGRGVEQAAGDTTLAPAERGQADEGADDGTDGGADQREQDRAAERAQDGRVAQRREVGAGEGAVPVEEAGRRPRARWAARGTAARRRRTGSARAGRPGARGGPAAS